MFESRGEPTPTVIAYMDSMMGVFLAGGFSVDLMHHAMHVMGSRILGFSRELALDLVLGGLERLRKLDVPRRTDPMVMEKPKSVAAYFKKLPPEQRRPLQRLRDTIAAAAPEAEEGITYSMPGFLLRGKGFVAYAAFKDHYSFFPMSSRAVEAHKKELGSRVTGKGTIQFQYDDRFPAALVKKVVRTRLAEATARRTHPM